MTEKYAKQLEIEKLNKAIIDNILNSIPAEDFIDFYLRHNQKETLEHFGLRTTKQLTKVLKLFNYDFSKPKPSKFKGKAAVRSHESYLAGGQKSANTQKQNWQNKSEEEKEAWSKKQTEAHSSDDFKQKIKQINIDYQANLTAEQKAEKALKKSIANKATWDKNKKEILEKSYDTKKANKSFNCSKPEDVYYNYLLSKYSETDIIRQYKDERYPHACDFYIKSLDLFIELNLNWTHGLHPFNPENPADINKLAMWQEKAKESKFYQKAIETWTKLDVQKFKDAKDYDLNYKVYYTEAELYE